MRFTNRVGVKQPVEVGAELTVVEMHRLLLFHRKGAKGAKVFLLFASRS
jgi:urease beta subunit